MTSDPNHLIFKGIVYKLFGCEQFGRVGVKANGRKRKGICSFVFAICLHAATLEANCGVYEFWKLKPKRHTFEGSKQKAAIPGNRRP